MAFIDGDSQSVRLWWLRGSNTLSVKKEANRFKKKYRKQFLDPKLIQQEQYSLRKFSITSYSHFFFIVFSSERVS
jgi:hypothetical protein